MTYRKSKYTKDQTAIWQGETVVILAQAPEALTIDEIKNNSIALNGVTNQKMARILTHLIDMGMVTKSKGKNGKMRYKSIAVMEVQGYDVDC